MAEAASSAAEIVQASGQAHGQIGRTVGQIAEDLFGDAANLNPGNGMFGAHPHAGQLAVPTLLTRSQRLALGLFFGWRCAWTLGA